MPSCGVCLSVCLSVTFVYSVETNKHIFNFFQSGSHNILVFPHQTLWQNSNGDPLTREKIAIFEQYLGFRSMNAIERRASSMVITLSGGVCVSRRWTTKCQHQWTLFMTASLDIVFTTRWVWSISKTTQHNLTVRIGESEAEVNNW